jgi:hypothetical protein
MLKHITLSLLLLSSLAFGQGTKSMQQVNMLGSSPANQTASSASAQWSSDWMFGENYHADEQAFDLLSPNTTKGTYLSSRQNVFGQQVMVRMQFADWLSLRLGVYDDQQAGNLFLPLKPVSKYASQQQELNYQLGISSVLNLTPNWRFGVDLSTGQASGDSLGLYQDQLDTASVGFGLRSKRFGASVQTDFMSSQQQSNVHQSTIDLQIDWHFNRDGTLSFGARKNMNEDPVTTSLDQFTGTVPYIKFKHNL